MTGLEIYQVASRLIGVPKELAGVDHNDPFIVWALSLCGLTNSTDEVPWCSAFVNTIAFLCGLERSHSAAARSWLMKGAEVEPALAMQGDVVILSRGTGPQPGPTIISAPGHVGFFASYFLEGVQVLGGNQGNSVSVATFPRDHVLGVRRLRNV